MEDKELQELFAAKRTVEANRRRQEQLAEMIGSRARKARPLWPVWATAIAAGIAVLLMTMPALFRSEEPVPLLLAQTEIMDNDDCSSSRTSISSTTSITRNTRNTRNARSTSTTQEQSTEPIVENPVPIEEEPEPVVEPEPEKPQQPQRRIHRRTSTKMVTSDRSAPAPRFDYREVIADALCQEESQPITLHTIKIS